MRFFFPPKIQLLFLNKCSLDSCINIGLISRILKKWILTVFPFMQMYCRLGMYFCLSPQEQSLLFSCSTPSPALGSN